MASRTANPLIHVNTVVEVNKIRKIMHSGPGNGFTASPAISYGLRHRGAIPNLRMTRHARFCWRQARKMRSFNARMAVAAIDTVILYVVFVAERDGLFR